MKIAVDNITGIEHAHFTLAGPITLIAGQNAAGKTSVLKAIGRVLCGEPLPPTVSKKDAGLLLKLGSKAGSVVITTDEGEVRADYPKAEYALVTGVAPRVGRIAAGLIDFSRLTVNDRAIALISAMKAACGEDDVKRELERGGIDDKKAKSVVDFLGFGKGREIAWESTADIYAKEATKEKGSWQTHAGVKWGSAVSQGWRPEGFTEDLITTPIADLKTAVAEAKANRDLAIAANGVDDETTKKRQDLVARLPDLDKEVEKAEAALQGAELAVQTAQAHRDALPTASDSGNAKCPCCEARLRIHKLDLGGTEFQISKVEAIPPQERSERLSNIAKADGDLANAKDKRTTAKNAVNAAKAELQLAYDAEDQINATLAAKEQAALSTSPLSVETCEAALTLAETRLRLADTYAKATTAQAAITMNLKIAEILGPNGIRKTKLVQHLDSLNKQILRPITEAARFPDVTITPEIEIQVGGRPFEFCSGSEQWLADAIMRLGIAKLQNAPVVILDAADILDMDRKNGLFDLLEGFGVPCLLGMTIPAGLQKCWDFADIGLGASFWVDGGVLRSLAEVRPMAKAA